MKVICWNMAAGFGYNRKRHAAAWAWLNQQDADVALVQEVVLDETLAADWDSVVFSAKDSERWGSAVLVRGASYRLFEPTDDLPWLKAIGGAACVAEPTDASGHWLVSLHSAAGPYGLAALASLPSLDGVSLCNPKRGVWQIEVAVHELQRVLRGHPFVAGGDLNSSLSFDTNQGKRDNTRLFANMAAAGFVDLRLRHHATERQTYFKAKAGPYQLDHLYADVITEQLATSWRVLPDPARELNLSDHAPIEVVFGEGQ